MSTLALYVLVFLGADLPYQENFAPNASFELDRDRDGSPDGWRGYAYDSPAQLAWDNTTAHDGARSLRISQTLGPGDTSDWKRHSGRWVSAAFPAQPASRYELSVWIKTEDVTGRANAHLAWQRGGTWLSETPTPAVSGTHDWQQVSVTAQAPNEADSLVISLNLSRSKGTAWFDQVRVSGHSRPLPHVEYVFNDTGDWFPFEFPLDDTNLDTIDLTGLLDAPAGKHGFLTTGDDGHFYFADGRRARFFGTNLGGRDCMPEKTVAETTAARLAKYGVNMIRLHAFDSRSHRLIDYDRGGSRHLNAEALDRFDYLVAQLKKRGIYIYLDLLDYRWFRTADGVKLGDQFSHNWQGSMKGASIFDPRMIELQKEYATQLLTHRNPYTGLRYVDDPAVAVVEITNENSVFYFFRTSDLSLPYYREQLTARWNRWLVGRYGNRRRLAHEWTDAQGNCALLDEEDPAAGTVQIPFGMADRIGRTLSGATAALLAAPRVRDLLRFFTEVQLEYYRTMHGHLRQIGVRVPIAGTNQMFFASDTYCCAAETDFISRNQYWRHPSVRAEPFFRFSNDPLIQVDIPTERNPLSVIARTSVAGKPQIVAEFNFPWPNEYRCEGLLMSAAYACLQDWDGFLLFSYGLGDQRLSMFRSESDPARWGEFPAAALLFHRFDVDSGRNEIHVVHDMKHLYDPEPPTTSAKYTNHRFLTFISKVRTAFADDVYRGKPDAVFACGDSSDVPVAETTKAIRIADRPWEKWLYPQFVAQARQLGLPGYDRMDPGARRFDSDTGQLSLDYERGLLTINTPRTQAAVGRLADAGPVNLDAMSVRCTVPFAAVVATSLDGDPLGRSRRVLLTCVGRAENTAQAFWPPSQQQLAQNRMSWMLPGEGRRPVLAEPIAGQVRLQFPDRAVVYSLDPTGKRTGRVTAATEGGTLALDPAAARSIWCEIVAE